MLDVKDLEAAIPDEIKALPRFVGWAPDPKSQRPKCPVVMSARERRASTRKPETWFEWRIAKAFYAKYADGTTTGIGWVFTQEDGFLYVDIDCALDAEGKLRPWAEPFVTPFLGRCYAEVSPSGAGLHIIGKGSLPGSASGGKRNFVEHRTGEKVPEVAMATLGRYTTLTGRVWNGQSKIGDCTAAAAAVWQAAGIQTTAVDQAVGAAPTDAELPDVEPKHVPRSVKAELKDCTAADVPDRSAARFKLYADAAKGGLVPEEIFSLVVKSEWYTASGAQDKGREQTWADIARCVAKADTAAKEFADLKEATVAESKTAADDWKAIGVVTRTEQTKDGPIYRAVYGAHNMATVLSKHPAWKGRLRLNEFKERMEIDGRPFADEDTVDLAEAVRAYLRWDQEPPLNLVFAAALRAARAHAFNPLQDYLNGLVWDGTKRIDDWLVKAGCEVSDLNRLLGRKWLVSLAARALRPGCKVDTVLILEGLQGKKKSSLLRAIAGGSEYFTDAHVTYDKDGLMVMHGAWIVEIAELSTFKGAEMARTKQFLGGCDLTFRPPYGRVTKTFPRHFVITGSTNDEEYLDDPSGERRYWPVKVTDKLDVAWVEENRDQLLAEAVAALNAGEEWWFEETPEALKVVHEERKVQDPLRGKVLDFVEQVASDGAPFTMANLLDFAGLPVESMSIAKRVGIILRSLGYTSHRSRGEGSRRRVLWRDSLFDDGENEERLAS